MVELGTQLKTAIDHGFDPQAVYIPSLEGVNEPMRTILEKYGNIPPPEITRHAQEVRDRAFKVFPYPCIGRFLFLDLWISRLPQYPEILDRVKRGEKLLDLGCAFGQELRQLVYDGAPSKSLYGSDLHLDFINLGYDLFQDRSSLKAHFIASDILVDDSKLVSLLTGQVDILYAALVFHLFDWDQQLAMGSRVVRLLSEKSGSMIIGRNVTYYDPEAAKVSKYGSIHPFYHSLATWTKMWELVQQQTGIKFRLETWEQRDEWIDRNPEFKGVYMLCFSLRRE